MNVYRRVFIKIKQTRSVCFCAIIKKTSAIIEALMQNLNISQVLVQYKNTAKVFQRLHCFSSMKLKQQGNIFPRTINQNKLEIRNRVLA